MIPDIITFRRGILLQLVSGIIAVLTPDESAAA
jgi:hypothetical protein